MLKDKTGSLNSIALVFIGVLLAVGLFAAWLAIKPEDNSSSIRTSGKIFINSEFGYEFDYPLNWKEIKGDTSELGENLTGSISREKPLVIAGIRVVEITDNDNFDTLPEILDRKMAQSLKGFRKIKDEFLRINGQKVIRYSYAFQSVNNIEVKQMQQITVKNGKAYYFIFHSTLADFKSVEPEINQIADSFRFK